MKPILLLLVLLLTPAASAHDITPRIVSVKKIWDAAPHNAFTDLIRFKDRWYCTFRESEVGHVEGEGKLRVLESKDGERWESVALITEPGRDLRDAKLSITPDNRLMLNGGSADPKDHTPKGSFYSVVSFSKDGHAWPPLAKIEFKNPVENRNWLWRSVWHKGTAYGVAYQADPASPQSRRKFYAFACKSADGIHYKRISPDWFGATEAAILFDKDDLLTLVIRGGTDQPKPLLLQARAPYTDWTRRELTADDGGDQLGGPDVIRIDGQLYCAARRFMDKPPVDQRTGLLVIDEKTATMKNLLLFPSGGDGSYPGLVWHNGQLWMSYYSSHEGKPSIYLAKIDLPKKI